MIYDLSDFDELEYNFETNTNIKIFVENIIKNGEDINFIKDVFNKTKDKVSIVLPYNVFVTACKNEDIDYCKMFVELFPNQIFIEIEDDTIVDYGKIDKDYSNHLLNVSNALNLLNVVYVWIISLPL